MKKIIFLGAVMFGFCNAIGAFAAANVLVPKKAASVQKQETTTLTTGAGGSLLDSAAGLVGNVIALNQQQKALVAECEPTSREIDFVNKLVKEWAYTGATNPLGSTRGFRACTDKESYESTVRQAGLGLTTDAAAVCYDTFPDAEARGAVWAGFPRAAVVEYCSDGSTLSACSRNNRKKVTNMWTIFDMVNFDEKDYTKSEWSQAQALLQKAVNCSGTKLAAKRLESFGGFVTSTIGNMGQKTNTGSIMESVGGIIGSTGIGGIGGLANVATQFLDR